MLKWLRPGNLAVADAAAVVVSFSGADWLSAAREHRLFAPVSLEWACRVALIAVAWLGAIYIGGAYQSRHLRMRGRSLYLTALATGLAGALCAGLFYLVPGWRMNRLAFLGFVGLAGLLLTCNRLIWLQRHQRDPAGDVLAIGESELLLTVLRHAINESYIPGMIWLVPDGRSAVTSVAGLSLDCSCAVQVCSVREARGMLASAGSIDTVITDGVIRSPEGAELLTDALLGGALVADAFSFYEWSSGKCPIFQVDGRWLFNARRRAPSPAILLCKRAFDLVVGLLAAILTLPLLAVAAVAIVMDSGFPILYRQQRMGRQGKCFALLKLRTMRRDAEAETGPVWSPDGDPRVTRVGRFLRHTGIDELPQLWNVLLGEMSLVGPRPERPEIVDELRYQIPLFMQRHAVPPGIAGWAQVNQGADTCVQDVVEKLRYDLYYAENFSLRLDLRILLRTFQMALALAKPPPPNGAEEESRPSRPTQLLLPEPITAARSERESPPRSPADAA